MLKKFIIAGLLISHNVSLLCVSKISRSIIADMTAIREWRDALPFKSKIVAYVDLVYVGLPSYRHDGYALSPYYNDLRIGYISDRVRNDDGTDIDGFNISTLVERVAEGNDPFPFNARNALINSELIDNDMHMRLATKLELLKLRKLLDNFAVYFSCMDQQFALRQVNDQLSQTIKSGK